MSATQEIPRQASELAACKGPHNGGMRSQFGHPRGILGTLVGHLMARKNAYMHDLAVDALDVRPDDCVLEIGFGHGRAIQLIAARAVNGRVAGIDHSETMVRQAHRRNESAIRDGRVELRQGSVSSLPWGEYEFTKALDINCFHHWPNQAEDLREVRRVLKPGGLLLLCLRMKHPGRSKFVAPGYTAQGIDDAVATVRGAGFSDVRTEFFQLDRGVTCLFARA